MEQWAVDAVAQAFEAHPEGPYDALLQHVKETAASVAGNEVRRLKRQAEKRQAGKLIEAGPPRLHGEKLRDAVRAMAIRELGADPQMVGTCERMGRVGPYNAGMGPNAVARAILVDLTGALRRAVAWAGQHHPPRPRGEHADRLSRVVQFLEEEACLSLNRTLTDPPGPPGKPLTSRDCIACDAPRMFGELSDRKLAAVSIIAGNWPAKLGLDSKDPVTVDVVLATEEETMKKTRQRAGLETSVAIRGEKK